MSTTSSQGQAARNQRPKIFVAALLAVGLLVALSWNHDDDVETEVHSVQPPANAPPPRALAAVTPTPALSKTELPEVNLAWIVDHNPFDLAVSDRSPHDSEIVQSNTGTISTAGYAPQPRPVDESSAVPTVALPNYSVSAIVNGGGSSAALIGDRIFYENDVIDECWRIVEISSNGIVVEPVPNPALPRD